MARRRTLRSAAIALGLVISPAVARAETPSGFAVNRFEPSERGSEWFVADTLDLRGNLRPALGVVADYSYRSLVAYKPDGSVDRSPVRNLLFAHAGGSMVLADRVRLALSLPVQAYADGHDARVGTDAIASPPNEQGLGDLRAAADVRLFGKYGDAATGAIGLQLWLPTGSRDQYTTDGEVRIRPRAMVAGDVAAFVYAAQLNVAYRARSETIAGGAIGSEVGFAASAGLRVADRKLVVGPEIYGSTVLDDPFANRTTPVEGLFGAHYLVASEARLGAAVGTGFTRGFGSPEARALLSFEWVPAATADSDGDGVDDKEDACPNRAGARTADPKTNGCPVVAPDRDGDGVLDRDDACFDVPGAKTDDPATNGCPPDRDRDGVIDAQDACPSVPGPGSPDASKNGCPLDSDNDGVIDLEDACPSVPGLKTSDPKTNGCPDPDRDKDGIPNDVDACPDEAGPRDADPKRSGCPKAFVKGGEIKILDQVKFKTASAEIEKGKDSEEVLDAVLAVLKGHPEITKIRVEGHTDDRGAPAMNKRLSADRAAAVVKWLTAHGIDKARLVSEGFGQERPIESNETEAGRRNNRRVEFHIVEQDAANKAQ